MKDEIRDLIVGVYLDSPLAEQVEDAYPDEDSLTQFLVQQVDDRFLGVDQVFLRDGDTVENFEKQDYNALASRLFELSIYGYELYRFIVGDEGGVYLQIMIRQNSDNRTNIDADAIETIVDYLKYPQETIEEEECQTSEQ